jgi:carbon storage regulator
MLVLTRKTGQKLIIGDSIEVTILEAKGDCVKIGIQAPKDISVYREEIYEEIKKANQQALQTPQTLENVMQYLDTEEKA